MAILANLWKNVVFTKIVQTVYTETEEMVSLTVYGVYDQELL